MLMKKSVHGRNMVSNIIPDGVSIEKLINQLRKKRWDYKKIGKKYKSTYYDCKINLIIEELAKCDDINLKIIIKKHILSLYDDNVGKRYCCLYLLAYAINRKKECTLEEYIKNVFKNYNENYHHMQIKKIISSAIEDGKYLEVIDNDINIIDKEFFLNWSYYYECPYLNEVLKSYKKSISNLEEKKFYENIFNNRHTLYYNILECKKMNFSNPMVKRKKIKKNNKVRTVYYVDKKSYEYVTIKYLKKILDYEFNINYPNRNNIMMELFQIIENINLISRYTIFRFDIENFFESVKSQYIYEKYIKSSNLDHMYKELIKDIIRENNICYPGLATSNVFTEIAGKCFDNNLKSELNKDGLIFYSRYVDDGIIILNNNVSQYYLEEKILKIAKEAFGDNIVLHNEKKNYITKKISNIKFDYLGYLFIKERNPSNGVDCFKYGITEEKINKYKKRLNNIIDDYLINNDVELLRHRINYFISRIVYYNNFSSKYSNIGSWDVTGITANYSLLKNAINLNQLEHKTKDFINNIIFTEFSRNIINKKGKLPYFLSSKNKQYYSIKYAILKNKSIVFHPNIGWTFKHLKKKIKELDSTIILRGKSYKECVSIYYSIIKIQR
ncbi:hypothetical protein ACLBZE_000053 [Clostridium perfringens]